MTEWIEAVASAQHGERAAFDALVRRFQDLAVGYAFSVLREQQHAEDAAQSAFLEAFQTLATLRHPVAFPAWLRRIVFKHCDRLARARKPQVSLELAHDLATGQADPHAQLEAPEQRAWIRRAIFELAEPDRTALVLFYFEDRRQREIAEFLELPVATVNNRIHAARKALAARMISMIERDLNETRPSRDAAFAEHLAELIEAVSAGNATRVRVLLELDPSLAQGHAAYLKTGLHWAAEKDFAEIARILLQAGADLNALTKWGMTPLEWAANMGNRGVATVLIERGVQPNLFSAAGLGLLETVHGFFDASGSLLPATMHLVLSDVRESRHTHSSRAEDQSAALSLASYVAARNGHTAVTRFLLERGADLDYRGFFGGTGLHWAAHNGHADTVELLLLRGANVTLRDFEFDATAQGWAAHGKHAALVERLERANPSAVNVRERPW